MIENQMLVLRSLLPYSDKNVKTNMKKCIYAKNSIMLGEKFEFSFEDETEKMK